MDMGGKGGGGKTHAPLLGAHQLVPSSSEPLATDTMAGTASVVRYRWPPQSPQKKRASGVPESVAASWKRLGVPERRVNCFVFFLMLFPRSHIRPNQPGGRGSNHDDELAREGVLGEKKKKRLTLL